MDIFHDNDHIPINWGNYLSNLGCYIKQVAADRCHQVIGDYKEQVDILDGDYQP